MSDREIHQDIKLTFASDKRFFGPGTISLLGEIDKCGNVREACARCGFSYSKGWTILRKAEEGLGYPIVERRAGGREGGSAAVTKEGHALVSIYGELERELSEAASKRFAELMEEYGIAGKSVSK